MVGTLRFAHPTATRERATMSPRQIRLDQRQKEYRDVDREADVPQDRSQPRAVAEIGEDKGDPHDQEKDLQFVDQVLRPEAESGQQPRGGKERKRLDAVEVG